MRSGCSSGMRRTTIPPIECPRIRNRSSPVASAIPVKSRLTGGRSVALRKAARRKGGKASRRSAIRMKTLSTHPRA